MSKPHKSNKAFLAEVTELRKLYKTKKTNIKLRNMEGAIIFEQNNVESPEAWSAIAVQIAASKYFAKGETSVFEMVIRIVSTIRSHSDHLTKLYPGMWMELKKILINQEAAYNSPVWFNFGVNKNPLASACHIVGLDDDMDDILEKFIITGNIFKNGAGAGISFSKLRAKDEPLSQGGKASGPLSFMKALDAAAGVIKSGGRTRRSANIYTLLMHHPDIFDFIDAKAIEEDKLRILLKAGYSAGMEGDAAKTVAYQNANFSATIPDAFMHAYEKGFPYELVSPHTGKVLAKIDARDAFHRLAVAAHKCGDPGVQWIDTINKWHTVPSAGAIEVSNPCLAGNTPIGTRTGIFKISDLDGQVIDILHNDGFVKAKVFYTGIKEVIRLHLSGGHYNDTTHEHAWKISSGEWVEAQNLIGKKVKFNKHDFIKKSDNIPNAVIAGFLFGEGIFHPTKNACDTFDVKFSSKDLDVQEYISKYLDLPIKKTLSSVKLLDVFREYAIDECVNSDREFPSGLALSTYPHIMSFLKGLYTANGSVVEDRVILKSSNHKLINSTQKVLSILGIKSYTTTNKSRSQNSPNETYDLNIAGDSVSAFYEKIGFVQEYKMKKLGRVVKKKSYKNPINKPFVVRDIEFLGEEKVFDFTIIEETREPSSLVCGFELHNCSEFLFLLYSSCNLASLNLDKFYDGTHIKWKRLKEVATILYRTMDSIVDFAGYPDPRITRNSKKYRPLGLGYVALGSLLMKMCLPYDSDEGREVASELTKRLTHIGYEVSQDMAKVFGHNMYKKEQKSLLHVVQNLHGFTDLTGPFKNAQVTVMAPGGTISFIMDAQSTGIEPFLALHMVKHLAGGGTLTIIPDSPSTALRKLNYDVEEAIKYILEHKTLVGFVREEHINIFATALEEANMIDPMGHLKMLAAIQPNISGAISKTVNLPESYTIDQIESLYYKSWKMGLKAVALYRDNSKAMQAVYTKEEKTTETEVIESTVDGLFSMANSLKHNLTTIQHRDLVHRLRRQMPLVRKAVIHKFNIGEHEGYLTVGLFEDSSIGELFIKMSKEGSTLSGIMDVFAISISIALQHGVPMDIFYKKFIGTRFEPAGITGNKNIPMAKSLIDYIFRWISDFMEKRRKYTEVKSVLPEYVLKDKNKDTTVIPIIPKIEKSGKLFKCANCGHETQGGGKCRICPNCGESDGCS